MKNPTYTLLPDGGHLGGIVRGQPAKAEWLAVLPR
jgi:hypothetical protein